MANPIQAKNSSPKGDRDAEKQFAKPGWQQTPADLAHLLASIGQI